MFYTEIGLTQYEMHDPVSFLDRYNTDMRIITTTATVAAGRVDLVEQESKDRDEELQSGIDTNHNDIVNNANDISELKAKDTELEGRIDLNAQDIAALQVTTTSISSQLLSHIETSTSFAAGVMQKIEDNYTELKTDIMADRERISVAEVAISNIQQGDTEIAQKVATLEADNTQNKNAIAALEQVDQTQGESIQDLRGRMTTAESDILANSNDITSLDGRMETAEQNIEDLQKQYTGTISVTAKKIIEIGPGEWQEDGKIINISSMSVVNGICVNWIIGAYSTSISINPGQGVIFILPDNLEITGGQIYINSKKLSILPRLVGSSQIPGFVNQITDATITGEILSNDSLLIAGIRKKE